VRIKTLYLAVFCVSLLHQEIYAGSLYGHFGVGEIQYAVSARSLGMGGVNLALSDEFTLSRWNPAQWSNISPVRVNFGSLTSYNSVTDGTSSTFTDFNGFSMGIPMGSKITLGGGINPISSSEYALNQSGSTNGEEWNLTISGSGGISAFGMGIAYQVSEKFAVGIKNDWLFGKKEEEWVTDFVNPALLSSKFLKSNSFGGTLMTIGFFSTVNNFNYAGSISLPNNFNTTKEIMYQTIEPKLSPNKAIDYPAVLRLGFTYDFGERNNFGLDYQRGDWSSFDSDFNGNFGTAFDIFGGIERKIFPKGENLFGKLALRGGFTFRRLYIINIVGSEESSVSEKALTFGIGIPAHGGKEIVDIGISYGLRSGENESSTEENTFLFMIGYSAGEKWFIRRRR